MTMTPAMSKIVSLGLTVSLSLTVAACGRDGRQGAPDIGQNAAGSPGPAPRLGMRGGLMQDGTNMNNAQRRTGDASSSPNAPGSDGEDPRPGGDVGVSQRLADAVAALNEVRTANVFLGGANAYVAVVLHPGAAVSNTSDPQTNNRTITDMSDQVKNRIAQTVKGADPNIRNVFVSANPDFVERLNVLAQDISNGRPIAGVTKEFAAVVSRVFPYQPAAADGPDGTGAAAGTGAAGGAGAPGSR